MAGYTGTITTSSLPSGWTVARSSAGTYFDSSGVLQSASSNVGRITYHPTSLSLQGLLLEPASTNSLRNNTMTGASSPSTLPAKWSKTGGTGLTFTIVGSGTTNGMEYIDLRLNGTATSTSTSIRMDFLTAISASNGQTWTMSCYAQVVAGSTTNISNFQLDNIIYDSGSNVLADLTADFMPTSTMTRYSGTATIASATANTIRPSLNILYSNGAVIDVTVRLLLPQDELLSSSSSVIKTSTVAVNRAAETLTIGGLGSYGFVDAQSYPATITYFDDTTSSSTVTVSSGAVSFTGSGTKPIKKVDIGNPAIGALPTSLPSAPDITVTTVADLKYYVNNSHAGNYYIAVPDGVDWDVGSTNISGGGFSDLTCPINRPSSTIYIAPASFYSQNFTYENDPYGDGNTYTRRLVRPSTLRGFIKYNSTVHLWGFKRTVDAFPTAPNPYPGTYQTWLDIGIQNTGSNPNYLEYVTGTFDGSFRWNEYFIGKDASHTPFDITEKLFDFNSPDYWNGGTNRLSQCNRLAGSFASGTDVLTVTQKVGSFDIAAGQYLVRRGTVPDVTGTVTILQQLSSTESGGALGGTGTYQISQNATASNSYSLISADNSGSGFFTSEAQTSRIYVGWGDTSFAVYNRAYFMPSAIYLSSWTGSTVTVSDNYIHDVFDGIRIVANAGPRRHIIANDNHLERLYHDYLRFNWDAGGKLRVTSLRNIELNPLPGLNDSFDSHGDASQAFCNANQNTEIGHYGWNIGLNLVAVDVNCRGIFQMQYLQMLTANVLVGLKSFANLVANAAKGFVAGSQRATWHKDSVYISQEAPNPRPHSSNFPRGSVGIQGSVNNTNLTGPIRIQDVICEGLTSSGIPVTVRNVGDNKNDLPTWNTPGRSATTSLLFANLNRATPTVNDYFLMMAQMGTGAGTLGPKFNTLAEMMSANVQHEVLAMFEDQTGADPSTTITSARTYVHGVEGTNVDVVPGSGVQWATYSPTDGTVIRGMAGGPGTMQSGQDIALQDTTAATNLTEKNSQVSLDGVPFYFRNITRPSSFFPTIDNNVRTAWSRFPTPSPSGTFRGFVIALIGLKFDRFMGGTPPAPTDNGANILGTTTNSNAKARLFLNILSPGNLRGIFFGAVNSGGSSLRWDIGTNLNRHTYLLACDLTQTEPDQVFKLVKDYSQVPSNTDDTVVQSAGGTKTFVSSDLFDTTGWGVFNTHAGGNLLDGSLQALRVSLYSNAADIPDITDVDVFSGFTADMLNSSDGSTPVDPNPSFKAFWQGDLTAWNSAGGVAAVGDTTNALVKQAGTYT